MLFANASPAMNPQGMAMAAPMPLMRAKQVHPASATRS
jgi:hypothetical protein